MISLKKISSRKRFPTLESWPDPLRGVLSVSSVEARSRHTPASLCECVGVGGGGGGLGYMWWERSQFGCLCHCVTGWEATNTKLQAEQLYKAQLWPSLQPGLVPSH